MEKGKTMTINEIRSEMCKHLCAKIGQLDCTECIVGQLPQWIQCSERMPEEDAMPVVHAHWKDDGFDYGYHDFSQCTACGWKNPYAIVPWFKFCPNCGAKMDEEIDDGYM
jgi:hypothetical protein